MLKGLFFLGLLATSHVNAEGLTNTTTTTATTPGPATSEITGNSNMPTTLPATSAPAIAPTAPATMTGAYGPIDVNDSGVQTAAKFAVAQMQKGTLVQVESAQVQVVAGNNYKMLLVMDENGTQYKYNVVVFVPLPATNQPMQLTNVQAVGQVLKPK